MRSWVLLLFFLTVVVAIAHAQKIPDGGKGSNERLEEKTKRDRKDRDGQKVSNGRKHSNDRLEAKTKEEGNGRNKQIKNENEKKKKGLESKGKKHRKGLKSNDRKSKKKDEETKKKLKSNDRKSKKKDERKKKVLKSKGKKRRKGLKLKGKNHKKGMESNDRKSKKNDEKTKKGMKLNGTKDKKANEEAKKELKSKDRKSENESSQKGKSGKKSAKHGKKKTLKKKGDKNLKKECPGTCLEDREDCQGRLQGEKGCSGGDFCCVQGESRKAGNSIKRFCSPLQPCNKLKGECRKKKTGCNANEMMFTSSKKTTYCTKKSCICCVVNNCSSKKKCTKLGGSCQSKKTPCDGKFLKQKKYCKGKKCGCCVPATSCSTKKACSKLGGSCQSKNDKCKGPLLKGKKYCKDQKTCSCCLPPPQCRAKQTCTSAGGMCVTPSEKCDGTLAFKDNNGKRYCMGKGCSCCLAIQEPNPPWCYSGCSYDPLNWKEMEPKCGGTKQSPIDLVTSSANKNGPYAWPLFKYHNYDLLPTAMTITNTNRTAKVTAVMSSSASIEEGELGAEYTFSQFHFHWGSDDTKGSQHTVDGKRYPGELNLVHYKTEYGSVEEAIKHEDGLAVLGIFLEIGNTDNSNLQSVIDGLAKIKTAGALTTIKPFPLKDLLPENVSDFYRYSGSRTVPFCNEIIKWTVFKEPIAISSTQMSKFRALLNERGRPLVDNFRPVQQLNGRSVYGGNPNYIFAYHGNTGPSTWADHVPKCKGCNQSPINIETAKAKGNYSWVRFGFKHHNDLPTSMTFINNGHTAKVIAKMSPMAYIYGGNLKGDYAFNQIHFHWGINGSLASDHSIDGQGYPGEIHVAYHKTEYGSLGEAVKHPDGLAAFAIFMKISETNNTNFDNIISGLSRIRKAGSNTSITPFPIGDIVPTNVSDFYRYFGSQTHPPCNEAVIWSILKDPINISSAQLTEFRQLFDDLGYPLANNHRPLQPLNNRTVYGGNPNYTWAYHGNTGPSTWADHVPKCRGSSQSPINIETAKAKGNYSWIPFSFKHHNNLPTSMTFINNGHTAKVIVKMSPMAYISGGDLKGNYAFNQIHFHWGINGSLASDHSIDGQGYPGEIHVAYHKTEYGSLGEAVKHADGLAAFAIFMKISETNNTNFDNIISGLSRIRKAGSNTSITPFPIGDIVPTNVSDFYRYSGSQTHPPCNEAVIWSILKDPINISSAQLTEFRQLFDDLGYPLANNHRPLQPLNNRTVYKGLTSPPWSYNGYFGQSSWTNYFPLCGGTNQSPVDIDTASTKEINMLPGFTFKSYDTIPTNMTIKNTGFTALVTIEMASNPTIIRGGFLEEYTFSKFHFTWGCNDFVGSDHTIDGARYPAEIHMVHYKTEYGSFENAFKRPDGIAAFGVFFQITATNNTKLNNLITGLSSIHEAGSKVNMTPFALQDILPSNVKEFYRYRGSRPHPTCHESVTWTVFKDPVSISSAQMAEFRFLMDSSGNEIKDPFRSTQPLNNRLVSYFKV